MLIALLVAVAAPSPEALRLGRLAAETGELATILPLLEAKETEELIKDHPDLSLIDREKLKATAHRVYVAGSEQLLNATAAAYARHLSVDDLRRLVEFRLSSSGKRYRSAMPTIILESSEGAGKLDFKGDVLAAYCKETGKLCPK